MDWSKEYHKVEQMDWSEIAATIKADVLPEAALRYYRPGIRVQRGRCQCPIHNGKDLNMSLTRDRFKCFVCGVSGDVVTLVKEICELPTRVEAMNRINEDFRLGLPIGFNFPATISPEVSEKVQKAKELRADNERKMREFKEWEARYHDAMDRWIALDKIVCNTPWDSEEDILKVCEAKEQRARVGYEIDLLLAREPRW